MAAVVRRYTKDRPLVINGVPITPITQPVQELAADEENIAAHIEELSRGPVLPAPATVVAPASAPVDPAVTVTPTQALDAITAQPEPSVPVQNVDDPNTRLMEVDQPVPDLENEQMYRMKQPAEEWWDQQYQSAPDWMKPLVGFNADAARKYDQLSRNLASGYIQAAPGIAGFGNLIGNAVSAPVRAFTREPGVINGVEQSPWERVVSAFSNGMFKEGGKEEFEQWSGNKIQEIAAANPGMDQAGVMNEWNKFRDSQEFFDKLTTFMAPGFAINAATNSFGNQVAGLGLRPDQQTLLDNVEQAVGGAIFGLPKAVTGLITGGVMKGVTTGVMKNAVTRIPIKIAEKFSPISIPYTPGNVAKNAAAGAVLQDVIREFTGEPSIFLHPTDPTVVKQMEMMRLNGEVTNLNKDVPQPQLGGYTPRQVETGLVAQEALQPSDGHGVNVGSQLDINLVAAGLTIAAVFSMSAFSRNISQEIGSKAVDAVMATATGPRRYTGGGLADVPPAPVERANDIAAEALGPVGNNALKPTVNPAAGVIDPTVAVTKPFEANVDDADIARELERLNGRPATKAEINDFRTDMSDRLEVAAVGGSRTNVIEARDNAINRGVLEGMPSTLPPRALFRERASFTQREGEVFDNFAVADQRMQMHEAALRNYTADINKYSAALAKAKQASDNTKIAQYQQDYDNAVQAFERLKADDPSTRAIMEQWSIEETAQHIAAGRAMPRVMALYEKMNKVVTDVTNFKVHHGVLSEDAVAKFNRDRPRYMPVENLPYASDSRLTRTVKLMRDRVFNPDEAERVSLKYRPPERGADADVVNNPMDVMSAFTQFIDEAVRDVAQNTARRNVANIYKRMPGLRGRAYQIKRFKFKDGRETEWVDDVDLTARGGWEQLGDQRQRDQYFSYYEKGKRQFFRAADPMFNRVMQFAPAASMPILNTARKWAQYAKTGPGNPVFPIISALRDPMLAKSGLRAGRSYGPVDTLPRILLGDGKAVNAIMDRASAVTGGLDSYISSALAIPYDLVVKLGGVTSDKIAQDLVAGSGFFFKLSQAPGGDALVRNVAKGINWGLDRSILHIKHRNMGTSYSHISEPTAMAEKFRAAGMKPGVSALARTVYRGYTSMLESVRDAAHNAFFFENYARMRIKLGRPLNKDELDRLILDTKKLTGDVSRQSGSKTIQKLASTSMYANVTLQGTRHMVSSMLSPTGARILNKVTKGSKLETHLQQNRSNRFWTMTLGGVVLPSIYGANMLSQWDANSGNDRSDAQDWWYNKTSEFERMFMIPIPSLELVQYQLEHGGKFPPFDSKYIWRLPIAPEFAMIREPVMLGLRAMGMVGPASHVVKSEASDTIKTAIDSIFNFSINPLVPAATHLIGGGAFDFSLSNFNMQYDENNELSFGGINSDKIASNSNITQNVYAAIGDILGNSGQQLAKVLDSFFVAQKENDIYPEQTPAEAAMGSLEQAGSEVNKMAPYVLGIGRDEIKRSTTEAAYVYKTENQTLRKLIGPQRTVELDSKDMIPWMKANGMIPPNEIRAPLLRVMTEVVYGAIRKKGDYKKAGEAYTELRKMIEGNEASRPYIPEDTYERNFRDYAQRQQNLREIQAKSLSNLESMMHSQYGRQFKQLTGLDFSYANLVTAVEKDVNRR